MPSLVNLASLIDDARCYELVRQHRWPDGVRCPRCGGASVARYGRDDAQPHRQRYRCAACGARFDDLTGTVLAGHHRKGLTAKRPPVRLEGEVEIDEVYVVAGHKGSPAAVAKGGAPAAVAK